MHATTSHGQPIGRLKEVRRRGALLQGGQARCVPTRYGPAAAG
ncbi:hypothetical protein C7S14_6616 [Burkholderia cepacia]|nr:hypothetical protein C7S14_6616 [Burkholderia cepacia]